jgi:hypothetical protein
MSKPGIVLTSVVGGLAFAAFVGWVTWNFVLTRIGRVMVLMFFGIGDMGGQ